MSKLKELAEKVGISSSYIDKVGEEHFTSDNIRRFFLDAMGWSVNSDDEVENSLRAANIERPLKHVLSFFDNEKIEFAVSKEGKFSLEIKDEAGNIVRTLDVNGKENIELNGLKNGYYSLILHENKNVVCESLLIVAPEFCYQPDFLKNKEHIWGTAVMLYALRSENNMGIGDFGDLAKVVQQVADAGGDVVGVNPLGVMSPCTLMNGQMNVGKTLLDEYNVFQQSDVSPYRTLSRLFVNYAYLDLKQEPDFMVSSEVQNFMALPEIKNEIESLRASDKVKYKEVLLLKRQILSLMYRYFNENADEIRAKDFEEYKKEKSTELDNLATFEVLLEQNSPVDFWRYWDGDYDDAHSQNVKKCAEENAERVDFYKYCHWLADRQIKKVQQLSKDLKMKIGIYADMPIGAASNGVEVWENPEAFVLEAGIGAPADPMRPKGQSWGFTPYHPQKLKEQQYAPFIKLVRENMQYCGALRIDHAMGLRRLFWGFFADNNPVVQGAYIYYDMKDMTAILALESNRKQCMIIGEDLGTVPEGFREYMAEHGLLSYKVFCRQKSKEGSFVKPEDYIYGSLAQVSTHDQATAYGFWCNEDIEVFNKCGLYVNNQQYLSNLDGRRKDRENILKCCKEQNIVNDIEAAEMQNSVSDGINVPQRINVFVNQYGAKTNSALFLVRLNDIYKQVVLDNAPGTVSEYPNWRIKMPISVEKIATSAEFGEMTEMIKNNRP